MAEAVGTGTPTQEPCRRGALMLALALSLAAGSASADTSYDWKLPGPDAESPIGSSDPLDSLHRLLEQAPRESFFGELSYLASGRASRDEREAGETLAASDYGWLLAGKVGDLADWILLGRLRNADAGEDQDFVDPDYMTENENLLRIGLAPTVSDRVRLTGRYGQATRQTGTFYRTTSLGVSNGPLEQREGGYIDLSWSHFLTAHAFTRLWTGVEDGQWNLGAQADSDSGAKDPGDYGNFDFPSYGDADYDRYAVAGDLTIESWLDHRLTSGVHFQSLGFRSITGSVEAPDDWPQGRNEAWVSDGRFWQARMFLGDRWRATGRTVLEPRLEYLRYELDQAWDYLTPAVRAAFSPNGSTVFSADLGYEVRPPSFGYLLEREANEYTRDLWGDPERGELAPETARKLGLAWDQAFWESYSVALEARYQLIEDAILRHDLWGLEYDSDPNTSKYFYWNGADATAWSVLARARRRMHETLVASAEYEYGEAIGELAERPKWLENQPGVVFPEEFYLDWDVRHRVRLLVDYTTRALGGIAASLSWDWNSGSPYTPRSYSTFDMATGSAITEPAEFNSVRLPVWSDLSLSLTKDVQVNKLVGAALNVQVQNILDRRNVSEVNNQTGSAEPQLYSGNTGSPRTVRVGLILKF